MHKYKEIIKKFRNKNVLVVGDLILDHYIWGKVTRISPEAPVPVVDVTRENFLAGGAANVAHNIISVGGKAAIIGITGKDRAGEVLISMLDEEGVNCGGIFESERPTTIKSRVIANNQQVVRFDREDNRYVDGRTLKHIFDFIDSNYTVFDAIVISDYKKGVVSRELVRRIINRSKRSGTFIAVDPKVGHFDFYKGVSLITPNVIEAASGAGIDITDESSLQKAGRRLMRNLRCKAVLITRGEQGMSLFKDDGVVHIPTVARKVYDVTGAGDTVIAAFTIAYASGASMEDAAVIANHAAGVVVGEVGTAVATPAQITESFR